MPAKVCDLTKCSHLCTKLLGGTRRGADRGKGFSLYQMGYSFCALCNVFMKPDYSIKGCYCRCCGWKMRSRPVAGNRYKRKYQYWEQKREAATVTWIEMAPRSTLCNNACRRDFGGINQNGLNTDMPAKGGSISLYKRGYKFCSLCMCYFATYAIYCACCGRQLRMKPRNSKTRRGTQWIITRKTNEPVIII